MKKIYLFLLVATVLAAQNTTAIKPLAQAAAGSPTGATKLVMQQVAAPPTATPTIQIVMPDGSFRLAKLSGFSITIDDNGQPVIKVDPIVMLKHHADVVPTKVDDLTYTLPCVPVANTLKLRRNGIWLTAGKDYTLAGTTITFFNGAQPTNDPSELLFADFEE